MSNIANPDTNIVATLTGSEYHRASVVSVVLNSSALNYSFNLGKKRENYMMKTHSSVGETVADMHMKCED